MKKLVILSIAFLAGCGQGSNGSLSCGSERLCNLNLPLEVDTTGVTETPVSASKVSSQGLLDGVLSLTPTLTLVGSLATPTLNGQKLQASDITVKGTKIYVAYNTAGETQAGGIDVIDISVPTSPTLKSEKLYATSDIHKVFVDGSNLYAAGATSAGDGGGLLLKIPLDLSGSLLAGETSTALHRSIDSSPAYAGVSVMATSQYVYAVSGNNGGLHILNKSDLSERAFTNIPNARDVSTGPSGEVYVVTGKTNSEDAKIRRLDPSSGAIATGSDILLPGAQIDEAKSTIMTGSLFHIATAGFGGAKLLCVANGTSYGAMANPALSGLAPSLQTANAAAFGNGLIYVANGEAGVSIYSIERTLVTVGCAGHSVVYRGRFTFGAGISANNVYWTNGFLVVATGRGGFQIVRVTQSLLAGLLQLL